MSLIDFPLNPTPGQLFPDPPISGYPQYQWDASRLVWGRVRVVKPEISPVIQPPNVGTSASLTLSVGATSPQYNLYYEDLVRIDWQDIPAFSSKMGLYIYNDVYWTAMFSWFWYSASGGININLSYYFINIAGYTSNTPSGSSTSGIYIGLGAVSETNSESLVAVTPEITFHSGLRV